MDRRAFLAGLSVAAVGGVVAPSMLGWVWDALLRMFVPPRERIYSLPTVAANPLDLANLNEMLKNLYSEDKIRTLIYGDAPAWKWSGFRIVDDAQGRVQVPA